jgi:hypothetical protein
MVPRSCFPAPNSHLSVAGRCLEGPRERERLGTEKALGWSVELLERPRKGAPEEVL